MFLVGREQQGMISPPEAMDGLQWSQIQGQIQQNCSRYTHLGVGGHFCLFFKILLFSLLTSGTSDLFQSQQKISSRGRALTNSLARQSTV